VLAALLALLTLTLPAVAPALAPADTLVFGSADNGIEGDDAAATLRSLGALVDRSATLPADLSPYSSIWYVEAYEGLSSDEQTRLEDYVRLGGSLYLTGERPCCEVLNASVQAVLHELLKDQDVTIGGMGDIDGPFTFNPGVADGVANEPNLLVDFVPHSPGGMAGIGGVSARNVFASNGVTPVGAIWDNADMRSGTGRIALLMDIDWLADDARTPIVENIQNFLEHGSVCSNAGPDDGFVWTGPSPTESPANCSTIVTPAQITWKIGSDSGPVSLDVTGSAVDTDCSYENGPGAVVAAHCTLANAQSGATLRVTAGDAIGTVVRHYRVVPKNDPRNVPPGYATDSNWWDWPDGDQDGIPDYWEQQGVWVKGTLLDLPSLGANPQHKDLFLHYDFEQGSELDDEVFDRMRGTFANAPLSNPDGTDGVTLHVERGASVPASIVGDFKLDAASIQRVATYSGFANSPEYGGQGVPQLFKWMLNFDHSSSDAIGTAQVKGFFGWTAFPVNPWIAALNVHALPQSAADFAQASNATHELGHLLGLRHHGTSDSPENDGSYKSVMSYAYSNFGLPGITHHIDYSRTDAVNLDWRMGQGAGQLTFVPGQWGEQPDFYATSNDEQIDLTPPTPSEPPESQTIAEADPASVLGFIGDLGVDASPDIPTLAEASATVKAGATVHVPLAGGDPLGAPITYAIDDPPHEGTATPTATGIDYTANSDAGGEDTLLVRATNGLLSSPQRLVTIHVTPAGSGLAKATPHARRVRPRVLSILLTRAHGHAGRRARLATLALRVADATRVRVRVVRLVKGVCGAHHRRCVRARLVSLKLVAVVKGRATARLTVNARHVARGRYRVEVTPQAPGGVRGRSVARSLSVG
jgi:hypothetical protein